MAPREDLIASAVSFLRDPSVASSPVEKRIEFLKSKNLTQEEIEISLAQASGDTSLPQSQQPPYYPPQQQHQGAPPPAYNNYGYPPFSQWQQPPPEPPKRDWRDWFIMATVVGGASYGVYKLAQRYIKPLIAPPTPPQLEQDKAAIDEQFNRAFALLDTLSQDTDALKKAEEARTAKLDAAITDIETIVSDIKAANVKREDDTRRMESEVRSMKDSLPRAIDSVRDGSERQLKELSTELASLKALMNSRLGGTSSQMFGSQGQNVGVGARPQQDNPTTSSRSNITNPLSLSEVAPGSKSNVTGVSGVGTTPSFAAPGASYSSSTGATPAASTSAKPTFGSKSASIPAWQMAAQNKSTAAASAANTTTPSTTQQPQDGADAVAALMNSTPGS